MTSREFAEAIKEFCGVTLISLTQSPIVTEESINKEIAYLKSRYDKGEAVYYNCPLTKEEFDVFYENLIVERVQPRDFELKD